MTVTNRSVKQRFEEKQGDGGNVGETWGVLTSHLHSVHTRLFDRLQAQATAKGAQGLLARKMLDVGHWAEIVVDRLEVEAEWRRHSIGGLDNMWLLLSAISGFNPVCLATYTMRGKITREAFIRVAEEQVRRFPKYGQRLSRTGHRWHGATFVDVPHLDVRDHVEFVDLPEPAGPRELEVFTSDFVAREWDMTKPLWESVILENYSDSSGAQSAMVTRGHHTLTDGQGFVMSQLAVTSFGPELEEMLLEGKDTLRHARRGTALPSTLHKSLKPLDRFKSSLWLQVLLLTAYWTFAFWTFILDLIGSFNQALEASTMFLVTAWRTRYVTPVHAGPRPKEKDFATSQAFPMDDVKKIQRAFSGPKPGGWADKLQVFGKRRSSSPWGHLTLNDILCSAIADVLRDEMDNAAPPTNPTTWQRFVEFSHYVLPSPVVLMIPISVREIGDWDMRNLSTGALAYLPVSSGLPTSSSAIYQRLHKVSHALKGIKRSLLPRLFFDLIQVTGQAPILYPSPLHWTPLRPLVTFVLETVFTSFTAVVTNVPGPANEPVTLAEQEVIRWTALPPQAGRGTLGLGIISYAGTISVSVCADAVPLEQLDLGPPATGFVTPSTVATPFEMTFASAAASADKCQQQSSVLAEAAKIAAADQARTNTARRIVTSFERRWQQYLDAADRVLEDEKSRLDARRARKAKGKSVKNGRTKSAQH